MKKVSGPFLAPVPVLKKVVLDLLEKIDTGVSLSVAISIRYDEVYMSSSDPNEYLSAASYLADAQAIALVRKNPWIYSTNKATLARRALDKFLEAEVSCKLTNTRFRRLAFSFEERSVLETARHFVGRILGECVISKPDFGPGSSRCLAGSDANIIRKLKTLPECTPEAYTTCYSFIIERMPYYAVSCGMLEKDSATVRLGASQPQIVSGNRFSTVPKDCRGDRPICIEPMGNMLLQKAAGLKIRQRLKKWGIDLDHADKLHANLAMEGSVDDSFATIDLSSASDMISKELIRFLLPPEWFDLLNTIRCSRTEMPDGSILHNEKFSSMGNGFTFELESLVFYSICLSARFHYGERDDLISVFGDDIIIETHLFSHVCSILELCGFVLNKDKTFGSGPFRESCGKDYFSGHPVRPIYLKELPKDENRRIFHVANRIREISRSLRFNDGCDTRVYGVWLRLVNRLPEHLQLFGPSYLGDDVIIADDSEIRYTDVSGCLRVKRLLGKPRKIFFPKSPDHAFACALYGIDSSGTSYRGAEETIRVKYAPYFKGEGSGYKWMKPLVPKTTK